MSAAIHLSIRTLVIGIILGVLVTVFALVVYTNKNKLIGKAESQNPCPSDYDPTETVALADVNAEDSRLKTVCMKVESTDITQSICPQGFNVLTDLTNVRYGGIALAQEEGIALGHVSNVVLEEDLKIRTFEQERTWQSTGEETVVLGTFTDPSGRRKQAVELRKNAKVTLREIFLVVPKDAGIWAQDRLIENPPLNDPEQIRGSAGPEFSDLVPRFGDPYIAESGTVCTKIEIRNA